MAVSPFLKSPLTDLSGSVVTHQWHSKCAPEEMKALDCIEAYGLDRGKEKCSVLVDDFRECSLRIKQYNRFVAMLDERDRQIAAGERDKNHHYAPGPPPDSY